MPCCVVNAMKKQKNKDRKHYGKLLKEAQKKAEAQVEHAKKVANAKRVAHGKPVHSKGGVKGKGKGKKDVTEGKANKKGAKVRCVLPSCQPMQRFATSGGCCVRVCLHSRMTAPEVVAIGWASSLRQRADRSASQLSSRGCSHHLTNATNTQGVKSMELN